MYRSNSSGIGTDSNSSSSCSGVPTSSARADGNDRYCEDNLLAAAPDSTLPLSPGKECSLSEPCLQGVPSSQGALHASSSDTQHNWQQQRLQQRLRRGQYKSQTSVSLARSLPLSKEETVERLRNQQQVMTQFFSGPIFNPTANHSAATTATSNTAATTTVAATTPSNGVGSGKSGIVSDCCIEGSVGDQSAKVPARGDNRGSVQGGGARGECSSREEFNSSADSTIGVRAPSSYAPYQQNQKQQQQSSEILLSPGKCKQHHELHYKTPQWGHGDRHWVPNNTFQVPQRDPYAALSSQSLPTSKTADISAQHQRETRSLATSGYSDGASVSSATTISMSEGNI